MDSSVLEPIVELPAPSSAAHESGAIYELAQHRDAALRFAYRISNNTQDAEDIVQQAFVLLLRKQDQVRPGIEGRALLLRCVLNVSRDFYRSSRRRQAREATYVRNCEADSAPQTSAGLLRAALDRALQALEDNLRNAVSLHYEQGLSYAEASQILSVPESTLRVYAQRGVQKMREKLAREGYAMAPALLVAALRGEPKISSVMKAAARANSKRHRPLANAGVVSLGIGAVVAGVSVSLLFMSGPLFEKPAKIPIPASPSAAPVPCLDRESGIPPKHGQATSAMPFVDTTPYGLIYAFGSHTGQGASSSINGGPYYCDLGTHNLSITFFRPPTYPAIHLYNIPRFLPGSIRVTKSDGTAVVDVPMFTPSEVIWDHGGSAPGTCNNLPSVMFSGAITYHGAPATIHVFICPSGATPNYGNTNLVQVQVNNVAAKKVEFMLFGELNGPMIIDP